MGCGCNKRKGQVMAPSSNPAARVAAARESGAIQMHDAYDANGSLIASYSNPVTARAEARRSGGTVAPPRSASTPAPLTLPGTAPVSGDQVAPTAAPTE